MLSSAARRHARGAQAPRASPTAIVADSDDDLMARVAAGDAEAVRVVVGAHLSRITAFAARTLGDRTEAEDVAQETFMRLWTHAARWEPGRARLTTWLHRVALNLCLDRRARRPHVSLDAAPLPAAPDTDVTQALQAADVSRHVRVEVMQLAERQRTALVLSHYQGLSSTETADVMAISVEAVESLLARARRTLRERLRAMAPALLGDA
ncbi:MAG TPA: RNA polymerase sigma factor [Candidatus Binatia bacterium]|nr:RNA polymerase sigma factor [Candidatus Binatia bacterium]